MIRQWGLILMLSWRNIWRNRRRTLITMASVVFAVILAVLINSLKDGILVKMQENAIRFYTGAIQLQDSSYYDNPILENSFVLHSDLENVLDQNEDFEYAPRIESFALVASEDKSKGAMVVGIDPSSEISFNNLDGLVSDGQYLSIEDNACMITEGLSNYLNLSVRDTIVVIGQGFRGQSAAGKYMIKGIVKMASPELNKRLIYLPLPTAQYLFAAENRVSSVVINPKDIKNTDKIFAELAARVTPLAVVHWKKMLPELDQMIQSEEAETLVFVFILYLLISFGIFGTILMMLMERQYEFGVLVAIGMHKYLLSFVVIIENLFITLLGSVVGSLLSIPFVMYFHYYPIEVGGQLKEAYENFGFEPVFYFSKEAHVFYSQSIVVLFIAGILSFYPIIKIMALDPVEAMRN